VLKTRHLSLVTHHLLSVKKYKDIAGDGGSQVLNQVGAQLDRLKSRMSQIRHKIAIMSGKGGVGKSSVTVNIASALALQGHTVGILDADINGPSIAKMMGVRGQKLERSLEGVRPATGFLNIRVMSMDLLLPSDDTPVMWNAPTQQEAFTWRGIMEMTALREFLSDTEWEDLDFLLLDLPPGSERLPNITGLLPDLGGTVIVTIPSEVSQLIVRKSITIAKDILKTPVIGLIENMAGYVCIHCGNLGELFHTNHSINSEHTEGNVSQPSGIPSLEKIPFDPRVSRSADSGTSFLLEYPGSPAAQAFVEIGKKVKEFFEVKS
jgi:ATP-binding protein involved in chromosome partitioning